MEEKAFEKNFKIKINELKKTFEYKEFKKSFWFFIFKKDIACSHWLVSRALGKRHRKEKIKDMIDFIPSYKVRKMLIGFQKSGYGRLD